MWICHVGFSPLHYWEAPADFLRKRCGDEPQWYRRIRVGISLWSSNCWFFSRFMGIGSFVYTLSTGYVPRLLYKEGRYVHTIIANGLKTLVTWCIKAIVSTHNMMIRLDLFGPLSFRCKVSILKFWGLVRCNRSSLWSSSCSISTV